MNTTAADPAAEVEYPGSDGKPIAENTRQFRWIATVQGNLDLLYADRSDVFVGADNLIYPVQGSPRITTAPDVYVAFGRPKGDRPSYKVWEEGGIFPQVVFEVLSPGNDANELDAKKHFYDRYGTEEYYILDPDDLLFEGWVRSGGRLTPVAVTPVFASPRLGIRFDRTAEDLVVYGPSGDRFLSFVENGEARRRALAETALERQRAEAERQRAELERQRADDAQQAAERLRARLRELGGDPDAV